MPLGPGKYDALCTHVREQTKARGVLLIVIDGDQGAGFSCQADLEVTLTLPDLLEFLARQIRADGGALAGPKS
jgi:hypothetical protein